MQSKTENAIRTTVDGYFQGTYQADSNKLRESFHPEAHITGNFDGQYVDFSLEDFIDRVCQANAKAANEKYDKQIIDIQFSADIAVVKAKVLVGGSYFLDYISLINIAGDWKTRHKIFTNTIT